MVAVRAAELSEGGRPGRARRRRRSGDPKDAARGARARGFLIVEAADGEEAWQRFQKELPDLIVTDLRMPRADGVALIRKIRRGAILGAHR